MQIGWHIAGWVFWNVIGAFLGAETVKGWILGDGHAWLGSFNDWPLYLALSVGSVLSFGAANWYVGTKCIERVRTKKNIRLASDREEAKYALKKIKEFCRLLANGEDSVMRSSRLNVLHERLDSFGLSPPLDDETSDAVRHYQRIAPYIDEYGLGRARQEARRLWKLKKKIKRRARIRTAAYGELHNDG